MSAHTSFWLESRDRPEAQPPGKDQLRLGWISAGRGRDLPGNLRPERRKSRRLGFASHYHDCGTERGQPGDMFVWWELRCDDPLFDLGHFRNRVFALAMVARGIGFVGVSAMFFIVPFLVQDVQGRSSGDIGLVFFQRPPSAAAAGCNFARAVCSTEAASASRCWDFSLGVVSSHHVRGRFQVRRLAGA